MSDISSEIRARLFTLQDREYRDFQSALIPTVNQDSVIGVRTPVLRRYAKELAKREDIENFLADLPHFYFEENNLHFFIVEQTSDFEKCLDQVQAFLPYVDNWATCDQACPAVFKRCKGELLPYIKEWVASDQTYTVRFGLGMLMRLFLDEDFSAEYLEMAAAVRSEEYYVNMMVAWYFATALAKQCDATLPYLVERRLPVWTHNKTIQKACESRRIRPEMKEYLRELKSSDENKYRKIVQKPC
ncbi:MAG: DNA alkylation repair protein [Lachnospiraceae bacterium]|nr:DNA alkylation repair protein [Lachnospiraceae bacterium]